MRRFSNDIFKILRNQPSRSICLSKLPQAFMTAHNHVFDVTDYGVCDIDDLLEGLRHNNFILVTKCRDNNDDCVLSLQKRRQTNAELEKTSIFAGEVVELLRNAPQYSIPFRKFVRSYHYYFGYQCKLSDYGYMRLAELLEALSGVVEMDNTNEENRKIFLSRKVALRIFSEQIQEIIKTATGKAEMMVKVDELMELHKKKFGYQMQGASLGYETVIDALKFVPFVELSSYENELWIVSHLENQKFRHRSMLACLTIVDIGVRVPLSKFHAVFNEKFKFNIHEKSLHAMKHAVDVEMVNGVKMISLSNTMKFLMHISNLLEQRKVMNVQEIKSTLKLSLTTCFNFGHPNLASVVQAFPDIFSSTSRVSGNVNDRSEIELNPECPFNPTGLLNLLAKNQIQISDEKPEMYRPYSSQHPIGFNANRQVPRYQYERSSMDVTMPTEVYQRFSNTNTNNNNNQFESNLSFYERNIRFQQQQNQMQALKRDYWNNSTSSTGFSSNSSSDNSQSFGSCMMTPFGRYQEPPPKPDTPPSVKPMGIWFDPVWKSDNGGLFDLNRNSNGSANNTDSVSNQEKITCNFFI